MDKWFTVLVEDYSGENAVYEYDEVDDNYRFVCFEDDIDGLIGRLNELMEEKNHIEYANSTNKEELKTLWGYLEPFSRLANEYNLTYEQLCEILGKEISQDSGGN